MDKVTLIAPCHFGLEAVLKREILELGYEIEQVEDGRVTFCGDIAAVCRANIFLRTAERVLLKVGSFKAEDFDTLFERTRAIPWEDYVPADGKIWVAKASSIKSKLFSTVTIQSVMKKAIAKRLGEQYHLSVLPENGAAYPLRVFLMKDVVVIGLDTSGEPLHKRGYRQMTTKAPIEETLAAALIMLTPWKRDRILADPFCGSGTFAIEAAMMGAGIAPGINRAFLAEEWKQIVPRRAWYDAANEADALQGSLSGMEIYASDIDKNVLRLAQKNAQLAGVERCINFRCMPVKDFAPEGEYGFIITNPPYGQRLEDTETAKRILGEFAQRFGQLPTWSAYVISPLEDTEDVMGRRADKKRKVYNGMLKTNYYQFLGEKPKRENADGKGMGKRI